MDIIDIRVIMVITFYTHPKICRFGKCKKPVIKLSQNKKDRKNFLGRVIPQLPAVRKDTIFGAARKKFRFFLLCDGFKRLKPH